MNKRNTQRPWALLLVILLLGACAGAPPLATHGVDTSLTPATALVRLPAARGRSVLWGGMIIASENLRHSTRIEVLGYPLDSRQYPELEAPASHRFLVTRRGYLETANYSPGRLLTVRGRLVGERQGRVGEAAYDYPEVAAVQLHLWPRVPAAERSRFHFGVGFLFSN